jgi:hypothetical protein
LILFSILEDHKIPLRQDVRLLEGPELGGEDPGVHGESLGEGLHELQESEGERRHDAPFLRAELAYLPHVLPEPSQGLDHIIGGRGHGSPRDGRLDGGNGYLRRRLQRLTGVIRLFHGISLSLTGRLLALVLIGPGHINIHSVFLLGALGILVRHEATFSTD